LTCETVSLPNEAHFHIGAFDQADQLQPSRHVFPEERLPWLHIGENWARALKRTAFGFAELDAFVDALAVRIASFDKRAIADTKRLVDVATLPPDTARSGRSGMHFWPLLGAPAAKSESAHWWKLRFRKASRTLGVATIFRGRESLSVERAMEQGEAPWPKLRTGPQRRAAFIFSAFGRSSAFEATWARKRPSLSSQIYMIVNGEQLERAASLTPLVPRRALPHDTGEAL
jgi:hypothetical protein